MSEFSPLFSVLVPIHDVEPWLPEFLTSLERQSLPLSECAQVLLIDDGSGDGSGELARAWAAEQPGVRLYLRQPRRGIAAARNLGLANAAGEWLCFCDPDDFLHRHFLGNAREFLAATGFAGPVLAANIFMFSDANRRSWDNHPRRARFAAGDRVADLAAEPLAFQSNAAGCFLNRAALARHGLVFDERLGSAFAEALLINSLLLRSGRFSLGLLSESRYYHRRQLGREPAAAAAWRGPEKYRQTLLFGHLALLDLAAKTAGRVPSFIQQLVLDDLAAYLDKMLRRELPRHFTAVAAAEFWDILRLVSRRLDPAEISGSGLPGLDRRVRLALLGALQQAAPPPDLSVRAIAPDEHSFQLHCLAPTLEAAAAMAVTRPDGQEAAPLWRKTISRDFYGRLLGVETIAWYPLAEDQPLAVSLAGRPCPVFVRGRAQPRLDSRELPQAYYRPLDELPEPAARIVRAAALPEARDKYGRAWLLLDRAHKADDNAEHLYRWLLNRAGPGRKAFFILDRRSPDWARLEAEGFALLPHGSHAHRVALFNAAWVISSHYHEPDIDPFGTRAEFGLPGYKFAFLGHGVNIHDMSRLYEGRGLDLFAAAFAWEEAALLNECSPYCGREIVLSGLPRHGALRDIAATTRKRKQILICPTWRKGLCRALAAGRPSADERRAFAGSDFYQNWNALTADPRLAELARQYGYVLLFLPHPFVCRHLDGFNLSPACRALGYDGLPSLQALLGGADIFITDYSSLAVDAALAGCRVLHYQPPETPPFPARRVAPELGAPTAASLQALLDLLETWLADPAAGRGCRLAPPVADPCARLYAELLRR